MKSKRMIVWITMALFLSACGGEGGSSSSGPQPESPEGLYAGTTSNGKEFRLLVLDAGATWAVYGATVGGVFYISGLISSVGGVYDGKNYASATVRDFSYAAGILDAALTSTYTRDGSIRGSVTYKNKQVVSFEGAKPDFKAYSYDAQASLSAIQGAWSDANTNITVSSTGDIVGKTTNGCALAGKFAPRATGKNVFDVAVSFSGKMCNVDKQTAVGNAIVYGIGGGKFQLIVATTALDRSNAGVFVSTR